MITSAPRPGKNRAIIEQFDIYAKLRHCRCKIAVAEDESNNGLATRQFRSLAQVYHTIREEYLPLYKATTPCRVSFAYLQDHMDTVLLPDFH